MANLICFLGDLKRFSLEEASPEKWQDENGFNVLSYGSMAHIDIALRACFWSTFAYPVTSVIF